MIVKVMNTCIKSKEHSFKQIYSFIMGNETKLDGSWRIYKCDSCKELKLITNEK
jgi:hypothetical protein